VLNKELVIPRFLRELHGEKTSILNIVCVYVAAIVAGAFVIISLQELGLPVWKNVLICILYFELAGGVVANLTSATNQYYQKKTKLRLAFILSHLAHPALLIVLFPESIEYSFFVGIFTISAALIVNYVKTVQHQQNLALLFVILGILISMQFTLPAIILYSFAPLFMMKLILGFSVKR